MSASGVSAATVAGRRYPYRGFFGWRPWWRQPVHSPAEIGMADEQRGFTFSTKCVCDHSAIISVTLGSASLREGPQITNYLILIWQPVCLHGKDQRTTITKRPIARFVLWRVLPFVCFWLCRGMPHFG